MLLGNILHDLEDWVVNPWKQSLTDVLQIGVLKAFANFLEKHLCWSFFLINSIKKSLLKVCWNSIKKRLQHRCFPVKFTKNFSTSFFTEHFRWLLLNPGPF